MRVSFDEYLRGKPVVDAGGLVLGEVYGLQLDLESWRVDGLRLKLRREAAEEVGAKWSYFHKTTIDIPTSLIQSVRDAVVLKVNALELPDVGEASPEPAASPPPP